MTIQEEALFALSVGVGIGVSIVIALRMVYGEESCQSSSNNCCEFIGSLKHGLQARFFGESHAYVEIQNSSRHVAQAV